MTRQNALSVTVWTRASVYTEIVSKRRLRVVSTRYLLHFLNLCRLDQFGNVTRNREHQNNDRETDKGTANYASEIEVSL